MWLRTSEESPKAFRVMLVFAVPVAKVIPGCDPRCSEEPMSLSTCERCGGHIPIGPSATNRCEKCGAGVFEAMHDPFPSGHLGDYMLQVRAEHGRFREALASIIRDFERDHVCDGVIVGNPPHAYHTAYETARKAIKG